MAKSARKKVSIQARMRMAFDSPFSRANDAFKKQPDEANARTFLKALSAAWDEEPKGLDTAIEAAEKVRDRQSWGEWFGGFFS